MDVNEIYSAGNLIRFGARWLIMASPIDKEQDRLLMHIFIVILAVILTSMVWYVGANYNSDTVGLLLDTSISIILTGIVAAIYYRQWRTEKEQAEIEREQKEIEDALKKLQSRPALDVLHTEPTKAGWNIYLGNFGFGPAHNLELIIDIDCEGDQFAPKSTNILLEKKPDNTSKDQVSTNAIPPNAESELFFVEGVDIDLVDSDPISLPTLFEEMSIHADANSRITIDLQVRGLDAFGEECTAAAENYTIVVEEMTDISDYQVSTVTSCERN